MMAVTGGTAGSARPPSDLAYVASGRADLYWERDLPDLGHGRRGDPGCARPAASSPTPTTAPSPLAARSVACGNEVLHRELIGLLRKANQ